MIAHADPLLTYPHCHKIFSFIFLFQQNVSTSDRITIQVADISPETADTVLEVKTLTQDLCDCKC